MSDNLASAAVVRRLAYVILAVAAGTGLVLAIISLIYLLKHFSIG